MNKTLHSYWKQEASTKSNRKCLGHVTENFISTAQRMWRQFLARAARGILSFKFHVCYTFDTLELSPWNTFNTLKSIDWINLINESARYIVFLLKLYVQRRWRNFVFPILIFIIETIKIKLKMFWWKLNLHFNEILKCRFNFHPNKFYSCSMTFETKLFLFIFYLTYY